MGLAQNRADSFGKCHALPPLDGVYLFVYLYHLNVCWLFRNSRFLPLREHGNSPVVRQGSLRPGRCHCPKNERWWLSLARRRTIECAPRADKGQNTLYIIDRQPWTKESHWQSTHTACCRRDTRTRWLGPTAEEPKKCTQIAATVAV